MDYVKEEGRYVEVTPGPCRLRGKPKMRFAIVWMRDWMVEVCVSDDRCRKVVIRDFAHAWQDLSRTWMKASYTV